MPLATDSSRPSVQIGIRTPMSSRSPKTAAVPGMVLGILVAIPAVAEPYDTAILQGLDKVTARISRIEAPVGQSVRFGTLQLVVRTCDKRPPEEPPESAVFIDIWEVCPGEPAADLFRGWMFASSPALSAMEHPVYDVWVIDCENTVANAEASSASPSSE